MGTVADSMDGIFSALRGGGADPAARAAAFGYDFSTLRPRAAVFTVWDGCFPVRSPSGCVGRDVPHHHERGQPPRRHDGDTAVDHPDIEDFIRRQAEFRGDSPTSISRCW